MPPTSDGLADAEPFWRRQRLGEMSPEEWESLCDGCGQCCRLKLEESDTGDVLMTEVACRLFDVDACRCGDYANRFERVPGCVRLTPRNVPDMHWLPPTCAYRLVDAGRDLEAWHPLVSGDPESVHRAGVSVRGEVVSEAEIGDMKDFLAKWYGVELDE